MIFTFLSTFQTALKLIPMSIDTTLEKLVFISYCRDDSKVVYAAYELLRAGGAEVFLDVNDIEYGERWQEVLRKTIARCQRILVFWSKAASKSEWVNREWRLALKLRKCVVPVPLDETPLPAELSQFHGVSKLKAILLKREHSPSNIKDLEPKDINFFHTPVGLSICFLVFSVAFLVIVIPKIEAIYSISISKWMMLAIIGTLFFLGVIMIRNLKRLEEGAKRVQRSEEISSKRGFDLFERKVMLLESGRKFVEVLFSEP